MTTLEKLERLVKEKNGVIVTDRRRDFYAASTLTEAIDKAYESAFPTRKLEPGGLFVYHGVTYRMGDSEAEWLCEISWKPANPHISPLKSQCALTIIGKAYDEPIEVKP